MRTQAGLTLSELLAALLILGVLLSFAMPWSYAFFQKNQLELVSNDIMNAVRQARNQALIHNKTVVLSPLDPENWSKGMILSFDHAKKDMIHQWQWHHSDLRIRWQGFQSKDYLTFASELRHMTCNGSFYLENARYHKQLIINRLGHTHVK